MFTPMGCTLEQLSHENVGVLFKKNVFSIRVYFYFSVVSHNKRRTEADTRHCSDKQ